jgi:hypothetical protein
VKRPVHKLSEREKAVLLYARNGYRRIKSMREPLAKQLENTVGVVTEHAHTDTTDANTDTVCGAEGASDRR